MSEKLLNEVKRVHELMKIEEQGISAALSPIMDLLGATGSLDFLSKYDKSKEAQKGSKSVSGKIKHNYSGKAAEMVDKTIKEMEKMGITNPYTQIGILSVIGKESGFTAVKEKSYCNTDDGRIVSVFKDRGRKCKSLKCNDAQFFECVYGKDSGVRLGNTQPGDGWKYVGRGLNGITGRGNYKRYGNMIGVDLESNPELLEKPDVSAKAAIAFFLNGKDPKSLPNFKSKEEAAKYFADINAGGRSSWSRDAAVAVVPRFDVVV